MRAENKIITLIKIAQRKFTSNTGGTKSVNGRHYHTIKSICDPYGVVKVNYDWCDPEFR